MQRIGITGWHINEVVFLVPSNWQATLHFNWSPRNLQLFVVCLGKHKLQKCCWWQDYTGKEETPLMIKKKL